MADARAITVRGLRKNYGSFADRLAVLIGGKVVEVATPATLDGRSTAAISRVFPLFWICQGIRSVFLPDRFKIVEPGRAWNHAAGAAVLVGWCVVGFLLCLRTFRWTRE